MRFALSEEQESLRDTVRNYLRGRFDATELRRAIEPEAEYNAKIWMEMAEQLGVHGLAIPEEYGGSGATLVELSIVLQEMGRVLLASPYFASVVLAATTLQQSGDQSAQAKWLPGIASGELIGTLAYAEHAQGGGIASDITVSAERRAEGWAIPAPSASLSMALRRGLYLLLPGQTPVSASLLLMQLPTG